VTGRSRVRFGWLWRALALCLGLAAPAHAETPPGRELQSLDAGWRFLRADAPGAERADFDDRSWSAVSLPHTFNAADAQTKGGYRGVAWYRRAVHLAAWPTGRRAYLQFDGAFLATEAWVNGRPAGRHFGGYAAFRFDVTDLLKPGRNEIAVKVDCARRNDVAPLGGDFTVFGGLYRDVHLLWTPALHVDALDDGGPGVYALADPATAERARIVVTNRVRNDEGRPVRAQVRTTVVDDQGRAVAEGGAEVDLAPGVATPVVETLSLNTPRLWDGREDPYLYGVRTEVEELRPPGQGREAEPTDVVTVPLGIRSFGMDPAKGFVLNGRSYPVHGVDYFASERPGRGLAVGAGEVDEDFDILDRLGVTGLRLVHFQHGQRAYEDADRRGIVVWTEIPLNSVIDDSPAFAANAGQQLRELIKQNYNHPSVVVWGLANEIFKADAASNRLLAEVVATAHATDPTRPTAYAACCHKESDPQDAHTDIMGYNRYFGWYDGEVAQYGPWADEVHTAFPKRAFGVSEYGAGGSALQQEDPPRRPTPNSHWHPEQYQALFHERVWRQLRDRSFLWGTFAWVGFDVISAGRDEGSEAGINDKGLVTLDRKTFKDAYFWYQANWSATPMVHITSPRDTPRTVRKVEVKVYANTAAVQLRLNGRDLGAKPVMDHVAIWPIELTEGQNRLEAKAVGGTASDSAAWTYAPAASAR
jgi:beta-galactosidase